VNAERAVDPWGGAQAIKDEVPPPARHHAITVNIRGNSYRLKEKPKAGLVKPADVPA
jgi:hypothetical protein